MIACTHVTMRVSLEGKGFVSAPWVPQYIIVVAVIVVLYWASVNLPISYGHKGSCFRHTFQAFLIIRLNSSAHTHV